ncbi:hypothetical protein ACFL3X_01075 [Gemmatimonadota bacterium]
MRISPNSVQDNTEHCSGLYKIAGEADSNGKGHPGRSAHPLFDTPWNNSVMPPGPPSRIEASVGKVIMAAWSTQEIRKYRA